VDGKLSMKGAWLSHMNHLNFGGTNHISGTADRLRCFQRRWTVGVRHRVARVSTAADTCLKQQSYLWNACSLSDQILFADMPCQFLAYG